MSIWLFTLRNKGLRNFICHIIKTNKLDKGYVPAYR